MHDLLPVPVVTPHVEVGPGFWQRFGAQALHFARAAGAGITTAVESVDADLRRDLLQMPLLGLTVLGPRYAPIRALPDDGHRPLVFLHGLGGHRGNFLPMRAWLGLKGRRRGYAIGMTAGVDLTILGRELSAVIEEILAVNGLSDGGQVDIVAHSMGGVVARLALLEVGTIQRVHTLVTLGTPHAGTQLARLGGTDRCRDLRPGSVVMEALGMQVPWRGPVRLVCLWSESDPIMQPAGTAVVEGGEGVLLGVRHTDYLLRKEVWAVVLEMLG
ncbi:MAG: triacylglycerol esterase/lipase EstA (alpha/beta hydrolase family) [Myxococcota bacterium]|jgi:triacylglycerol esterase/lipase EstA (alpha/beta hydrolase family)